ncbi:MAG: hypothetical protein EXS68_03085 [Candidatus Ryanbacteria bacterium]|nr:hypothetical protein [Candidatus Ryanbacteria bacterium]
MKGIIVIFVFVGALMSIQFFAFPLVTEVRKQWEDIAKMQTILENAERTKEDRIKYLDRLANVSEGDIRRLGLLVPNQVASEDLYVFLNDIVKESGLKAKTINIADIGGKVADKQAQKALSFDLNLIGPYGNMRKLLTAVEANLRLMDVEVLKITRVQDASEPKSFYALTLQGKFYYAGN